MSVQLNADQYIPTQRSEIKKEIDRILDDFMEPLYNFTVIEEIKRIAQGANLPQGFIDGVKFIRTAPNQGKIINTWGTEEKPLARYFNYGTTMHWIEAVNAKVLAWQGEQGRHATAIYFQGEQFPGGTKFSTGHYVAGIPATHAMERGYNIGKKRLAQEAGRIIQKELRHEQ